MAHGIKIFGSDKLGSNAAVPVIDSTEVSGSLADISHFSLTSKLSANLNHINNRWFPAVPSAATWGTGSGNTGGTKGQFRGIGQGGWDVTIQDHPEDFTMFARPISTASSSSYTTTEWGSGLLCSRQDYYLSTGGIYMHPTTALVGTGFVNDIVAPGKGLTRTREAGQAPDSGLVLLKMIPTAKATLPTVRYGLEIYASNGTDVLFSATDGRHPRVMIVGQVEYNKEFVFEVDPVQYPDWRKIYCMVHNTETFVTRYFSNITSTSATGEQYKHVRKRQYVFYPPSTNTNSNAQIGIRNFDNIYYPPYPASGVSNAGQVYDATVGRPLQFALIYNEHDALETGES